MHSILKRVPYSFHCSTQCLKKGVLSRQNGTKPNIAYWLLLFGVAHQLMSNIWQKFSNPRLTVLYFRHRLNHSVFKVLSESIGSFLLQFLSCVSWVSFNSLLMVVRSQFPGLFPFFRQRHTELLLWGTFLTAFATLREAFLILKKTKALLLQLPFVIQTFTKSESNSIPFGASKRKE